MLNLRVVLEALICFAIACLLGTLFQWNTPAQTPFSISRTRYFSGSTLHGVVLPKNGTVPLTRWKETRADGQWNWFPKRKKPVYGVQWPVKADCDIALNEAKGVWVDALGMTQFKPRGSFKDWVLTRRIVEDTVHEWKERKVVAFVWHPYVRFVAFYRSIVEGMGEAGKKLTFQNFCQRPLVPCPEGIDQGKCQNIIWANAPYVRAQTVCTHDDALHPVVDVVYDIEKVTGSREKPDLPGLSGQLRKELASGLVDMRERYLYMARAAETLYKAYPSCLDRVYELYHSDFLLLGYSKLKIR